MGMVYKRGNVWWIKYYRNGKPYRESTKSDKEADAKRLLKKREGEISQGKLPGIYFDKVKFEDISKDFLTDYRINGKKSIARAERSIKHLKTEFEGAKIPDITTPRIQAYIEKRIEEGAENATINRELSALKRMLTLGARQTPPKIDRVPYIPKLKENNVRQGFFEHADFLTIRDTLPFYLKGFVTFGYKTGWRFSEITGLTWNQIDLEHGLVRLEPGTTKNDEGRTIYLDEELKLMLKEQWEARKKSGKLTLFVFPGNDGMSRVIDIRGAWDKAFESTGIKRRLFHDLRRTAVRNLVRSGVPESIAMKISGHKTRSVFMRYDIVSDADLKLAAMKQETYLQAQIGTISGTVQKIGNKKEVKFTA